MKNITLVCSEGMSTGLLVVQMQEAAKRNRIEVEIRAMSEIKFKKFQGQTDILLLGPQIGFLLSELKAEYEPKGMKVNVIDSIDYGMMNGEKVLNDALNL